MTTRLIERETSGDGRSRLLSETKLSANRSKTGTAVMKVEELDIIPLYHSLPPKTLIWKKKHLIDVGWGLKVFKGWGEFVSIFVDITYAE